MMNPSPTTNEAYAFSPFMSFAGIEGSGSSQTDQKHRLWDWDSPNSSFFSTTHTLPLYTQNITSTVPPILNSQTPFFSTNPTTFSFPPPPPSAVAIPEYPRSTTASCSFKLQDGPLGGFGGLGGGRIGLNLGQRAYFSSDDHCFLLFGRSAHNQTPRCQAEGCGADLSGVKHYHRRHKVCEFHSKAAVVFFPGGVQQRFCQQCSRFHSIPEFDDAKRSCRKRLAEHNRRRRKSQSQPSTKCGCPSSAASIAKPILESKQSAAKANMQLSSLSKSNNCTEAVKLSIPNPRLEGQQSKKAMREYFSDSTLSLGGAFGVIQGQRDSTFVSEEKASQYQQQLQLSHFSSPFASSNDFIEHQSHFNEGTQSGGEGSDMTDHTQSSILQLGQAIFEWDFI